MSDTLLADLENIYTQTKTTYEKAKMVYFDAVRRNIIQHKKYSEIARYFYKSDTSSMIFFLHRRDDEPPHAIRFEAHSSHESPGETINYLTDLLEDMTGQEVYIDTESYAYDGQAVDFKIKYG